MVAVLIFCHDKREGEFFGKLCKECMKLIEKESLYYFVVHDFNCEEEAMRGLICSPELIIAEIGCTDDLERIRYIRKIFTDARLLLLSSSNQISPENYVIPEILPDLLLLKPYVYLKAFQSVRKLLLCCYKDRERGREYNKLLTLQAGGEVYYFKYAEIHYLEARDKKIIVHIYEKEFSFYYSLQRLEKELPEYFIRCHRSYIVNFMFVERADLANNIFYLTEKKTVIPISHKYKARLTKILQKYKNSEGNLG